MRDRLEQVERKVEELSVRIEALSESVRLLGGRGLDGTAGAGRDATGRLFEPSASSAPAEDWAISRGFEDLVNRHRLVFLTGLTSLVLAGAMVLRMVAISSPVPLAVGAGLGLAYCSALLVVAERQFRQRAVLFGDVFSILAILILGVLLIEVTHRPGGFTRPASYAVLAVALGANSLQAIRRMRLAPFVVGLLCAPVAGLAIGGSPFLHRHFAAILLITVLATQTGMRVNSWTAPRWGSGILSLAYILVLGHIAGKAAEGGLPQHANADPATALTVMAAFYGLHVMSAVGVALLRPRRLDPYEATAAIGAALLIYAAAADVLSGRPDGTLLLGALGTGLAILFYVVAAAGYIRHGAESGGFRPLSVIAFAYALAALALLIGGRAGLGAAYQGLALALAVFAARHGRRLISLQAHVLTLLAFAVLASTAIRLSPPRTSTAVLLEETGWLVLSGVMTILVFIWLRRFRRPGQRFRLHDLGFGPTALLLVLAAGGLEILAGVTPPAFLLGRRLLSLPVGDDAAALWFTVQTIVLAVGAVATLGVGVRLRLGGVTALGVGITGLTGLKLGLFDAFRIPGPYLACSSAVFGITLILSSILYRKHRGLKEGKSASGEAGAAPQSPP